RRESAGAGLSHREFGGRISHCSRAFAQCQMAGANPPGAASKSRGLWGSSLGNIDGAIRLTRWWLDPPERAHSHRAIGRLPGSPARRAARLANHLARLATIDVDV